MASTSTTISSNVDETFAALRQKKKRALVGYLTAGFPDAARSIECLRALDEGGADIIELGVPFSDPIADGPVIQASSQRALELGMTLERTLEIASAAKLRAPIVLFSYLNPVIAGGPDILERAAAAGVSGILLTDLPVGSDSAREEWLSSGPLSFIRLVAPTTPVERMAEIARHGSGFVYLISRLGVTGARTTAPEGLTETVGRLRSATKLPICAGFGISTAEQAKHVSQLADGSVVGSALVSAAAVSPESVSRLTQELRTAIDS
ncbi:MAG: tryptophan synthase subunit alpha [Gemmatimonadaceae bacterium]|nr:tryptophan synthase subunit alpha [Gemmatimonadaceae bacterium]